MAKYSDIDNFQFRKDSVFQSRSDKYFTFFKGCWFFFHNGNFTSEVVRLLVFIFIKKLDKISSYITLTRFTKLCLLISLSTTSHRHHLDKDYNNFFTSGLIVSGGSPVIGFYWNSCLNTRSIFNKVGVH